MSRSEVGDGFSARLGVPGEPGWTPATQLALDDDLLGGLLQRTGRGYGTEDRLVEGSFFLKYYLWRVVGSAVAAFLLDRRMPDLDAENLALRFDEKGYAAGLAYVGGSFAALPRDRDAAHPDAHLLSEDELLGWLRDRLASTHLPNLYAALRRPTAPAPGNAGAVGRGRRRGSRDVRVRRSRAGMRGRGPRLRSEVAIGSLAALWADELLRAGARRGPRDDQGAQHLLPVPQGRGDGLLHVPTPHRRRAAPAAGGGLRAG